MYIIYTSSLGLWPTQDESERIRYLACDTTGILRSLSYFPVLPYHYYPQQSPYQYNKLVSSQTPETPTATTYIGRKHHGLIHRTPGECPGKRPLAVLPNSPNGLQEIPSGPHLVSKNHHLQPNFHQKHSKSPLPPSSNPTN